MDKEQARQEIQKLVERFRETADRSRFNEAQTRHSFVLPLFRALGWNTEDPAEMSAEEQISRGFVDFGFYLNGVPAFYLETKKIHSDLERGEWAKQAMNYSWLRGVTWAALTDFEGMKVFNAEWQERDPHKALFLDLKWEDYADKSFDDLWLLSRAALQSGELNQIAERYGKKARKKPVNELLFAQLTTWRRDLFKEMRTYGNLFKENTQLVDDAVQRLLDRLIFIRTVEDRGVESPRLQAIVRQFKENRKKDKNLFQDLLALFRELDAVYNAQLFAHSHLDLLEIHDWKLLENIINGLYTAPGGYDRYDFNAINADVLGSMYEQYLSFKAADPTAKDAIDPHKQTKRKSQGIYYTPQFVVRYIVQQTLGKLLAEGADPYRIRVLDPACGSGSFLIEAFDVLDRHLAQHGMEDHRVHPRKRRLHILQHNLYGVDLDPQAVEVARLNLLLRAANERGLLPMLHHLKVGNSLIDDPDVAGEHAFDWQREFPEVMQDGGFDVVIGNPPYVRQETLGAAFKGYAQECYETYAGTADLYVYFIEKAHKLLRENGRFGMITSNKFTRTSYGAALRQFLAEKTALSEIIDFGELPVFQNAATFPVILITQNRVPVKQRFVYAQIKNLDFLALDREVLNVGINLDESSVRGMNWTLAKEDKVRVIEKIENAGMSLREYIPTKIYMGIKTGYNKAFIIDRKTKESIISGEPQSQEFIKPFALGDDIRKYRVNFRERYLIRIPTGWTKSQAGNVEDAWKWFQNNYPHLAKHLAVFETEAKDRGDKGDYWWELRPCDYYEELEKPKIIYPDIAKESRVSFDSDGLYLVNTVYFIPINDLYLLGILNSTLIFNYFKYRASVLGDPDKGGRLRWFSQDVEKLPIRKINFDDPADVECHDRMVALVEEMLHLKREHAAAEAAFEDRRHALAHRIAQVDREIDTLVYGLYGLTPEEIRIVEGG